MTEQPYLQYAAQIISAADEQDLSATDVFNGLSIAVAAMLVDYIASEDGSLDQTSLQIAINNFKTGLDKAAAYAVEQLALHVESQKQ